MELNRIRKDQITPSQQQYVCSIPHGWPAGGARPATTTSRGCGWIVRPETGARTDTHVALPIHAMGAGRRIPYVRVLPGSPIPREHKQTPTAPRTRPAYSRPASVSDRRRRACARRVGRQSPDDHDDGSDYTTRHDSPPYRLSLLQYITRGACTCAGAFPCCRFYAASGRVSDDSWMHAALQQMHLATAHGLRCRHF
jgi:hypothetical protein